MELQFQGGIGQGRFTPFLLTDKKAPSFDQVPEFDKEANSLFPVHVQVTEQGLVFVNLCATEVPSFDVCPILKPLMFKEYHRNLSKELSSFDFKDFELLLSLFA